MDQRDISMVRNVISYVEKFVQHNRGSHDKAFKHMVCWHSSSLVCTSKTPSPNLESSFKLCF